MTWLNTLASCGIAIGSPFVYLDQYIAIQKTKNSQGFSHVICLVLLTANITRLYYWLGERFDTALLIQSILMIIAQLLLLRICLKYSDPSDQQVRSIEETLLLDNNLEPFPERVDPDSPTSSAIPSENLNLRQSDQLNPVHSTHPPSFLRRSPQSFDYYVDFLALLFAFEAGAFVLLQRYDWFIQAIGFFSLGLESTLPIPQLITNYRRKSLAGLSSMVLIGWLFGDSFKSVYLVFLTPDSNSIQFKICALFQLSIDVLILGQAFIYRRQTKLDLIALNRSNSRRSTISDANNSTA